MTSEEYLAGRYGPGARDQRLEEFGQGRWADEARPSGWLALQADDVSRPEVLERATGDELLGIGRTWKSLETWSFTGKLAVVRELIRRYPLREDDEPGPAAGGLPDEWDPRLHHEVAAALGISVAAAAKLASLTWTLDTRLPGVSQALREDRLDPGRVRMIVDETSVLDREDLFARAETIILVGLPGCKTWSDLQRLVQRAVITVDPQGAKKRREQAEREHARIQFWREATGTCALRGTGLPTDQALAATANIEARAREYKAVPVRRPMDILRVMAYLDLINGVPVAQRAAWVQAEDEARAAEAAGQAGTGGQAGTEQAARDTGLREAAGRARDKFREKARAGASQHGASGDPWRDDGPGDGRPGGDGGSDPDSPDGGAPGGGIPGNGPGGRPGSGDHLADGWPGSGGGIPDGWPGNDLPSDGGDPGDADPGKGDLGDGGPGDSGPGGASLAGRTGDGEQGDCDPGGSGSRRGSPGGRCPECGDAGGTGGLPIRANLTLPAGALSWLAERAGSGQAPAGHGPGLRGAVGGGSGGGGPGSGGLGDPGPCPECGNRGSARMPVRGNLTLPVLTLLGLAERPGRTGPRPGPRPGGGGCPAPGE